MEIDVLESTTEMIIEKIERCYSDVVQLYRSVPVTQVIDSSLSNGWSVKDTLAHIAAWEWRCASLLEASYDTNAPLEAKPDIDALNQESYNERKEWNWEEVEYDFRAAHQALLEAIRQLPPERLNDDVLQENLAEETWKHYAEHLSDLQQWHKKVIRA